ncbi:MAG: hypothetical protein ACI8R0_001531 [Alteromonadales bacterium]|jgi:hypothetical protein
MQSGAINSFEDKLRRNDSFERLPVEPSKNFDKLLI